MVSERTRGCAIRPSSPRQNANRFSRVKNSRISSALLRVSWRGPSPLQERERFLLLFSISRALWLLLFFCRYDYMVDYSLGGDDDRKEDSGMVMHAVMRDDKRCGFRAVTSLNFSPKFPELLLVTYAGHDDPMSMDPDGSTFAHAPHWVCFTSFFAFPNRNCYGLESACQHTT